MENRLTKNVGLYIAIFLCLFCCIDGSCSFPSTMTGTWYSSNGGTLTFTSTTFSNFKVASFGSYTFTCEISSGTQYVSVSSVFYVFNLPFVAYICMDMTALSSNKYSYYQPTNQLRDAEYARMKIFLNNTATVSSVSDICDVSDTSSLERQMLVKDGTISSEKIQCPDAFLGVFNYTYDTGSGNLCTANTSLDVCTDNTLMAFDYNDCSQIQAYSAGGQVNCIYYTTSGSVSYLHVYNLDASTDESTYFRFTCYTLQTIDSVVYATQYPQTCHSSQNATSVNATGASLMFMSSSTCVPPDSTEETSSAYIAIIIVIVILLLIIILCIIFAIYMYKKKKEKERKKKEEEERALRENTIREKIENPDLRPEMDLGLPDDSKYNIDRLMFSDDKMVTPSNIEIERMRSQGFQGFDDFDDDYMDEYTRQNMIDASLFLDKRQRLDTIDEMENGGRESETFMKRFKELARSRVKHAKKRGKGKSKRKKKKGKDGKPKGKKRLVLDLGTIDADDWDTDDEDGEDEADENVNLPGQVETIDNHQPPVGTIAPLLSQRSLMTDRKVESQMDGKKGKKKKKKKKISSKIDSFNRIRRRKSSKVEDYVVTDDEDGICTQEETPRLILPNLRPEETDTDSNNKKKKGKGGISRTLSLGGKSLGSLKSFRSMRKAKVNAWTGNEDIDLPLYFEDPKLKDLPPLQRVHRKKNPQLWSEILAKYGGDLNLPDQPHKLRWSENKWRNLLEELYTDKRYFDYMTKSAKHNPAERDVIGEANEGLGYLQQRANFWKNQEPIPGRPSSVRSKSFVHSARAKTDKPKKSKSFVNSTSIKTDSVASKQIPQKEPSLISRENSKLSKENSKLSRENSMPPREHSMLSSERSTMKSRSNPSREKSNLRKTSIDDHSPSNRSPYDKSNMSTPRHKKINLPKLENPNTVYKMDILPKTPLTQVRMDFEREESMMLE